MYTATDVVPTGGGQIKPHVPGKIVAAPVVLDQNLIDGS
jgi:hypothetical protein